DRSGRTLEAVGPPGSYSGLALSPDGKRLALEVRSPGAAANDVALIDLSNGALSRMTFEPGRWSLPRWAPDSQQLVLARTNGTARFELTAKPIGQGADLVVHQSENGPVLPSDWSPDGRYIVFRRIAPGTPGGLWTVALSGAHDAKPIPSTENRGINGRLS